MIKLTRRKDPVLITGQQKFTQQLEELDKIKERAREEIQKEPGKKEPEPKKSTLAKRFETENLTKRSNPPGPIPPKNLPLTSSAPYENTIKESRTGEQNPKPAQDGLISKQS